MGKRVFFLLLVLFWCQASLAVQPLRIAYPEFAPFHYTDESGRLQGIFHTIINEAVERRMGVPLLWTAYPWTRCQENVRNGKEDAILTTPTAERATYTRTHTIPFYRKDLHIFTYQDHPMLGAIRQLTTLEDIRDLQLSVITYSGNGWHTTNVASLGIRSYETSSLASVWHMLARRRGDIVIEWPPAALPDIKGQGLEAEIVDSGVAIASMDFHLLIRKDSVHVDILEQFDATMEAMRQDGTLSAILAELY